ncbi:mechanosensitive ion channel family protein [Methanolobus profundi]|uniref:Conserved TM helix n=1 Tax=Methanolobus profundi TaxID=487685 RepID=A0A1I4S7D7_9EURY|nr:hypothetical protein [Methanolobus profundi]SFM60436.1 Conserved TM helix [Methanolobus profundi]
MATSPIMGSVYTMIDDIIAFLPTLVAVVLLLIVGKIAGKALGKIGSKILDKIGLDDLIDRTTIGKMIERTNITTVEFFDATIRWFVYFVFAVIIIDLLNVQIVADFITQIILYIPLILSAIVVLIIGLLVVDFLANLVKNVLVASGVDDSIAKTSLGSAMSETGMTGSGLVSLIVQVFGYLLFIMAALNILNLDMIAGVIESILGYLPNLFAGILILLIGLLSIDVFADYIGSLLQNMNVEGTNIWIPALRGFLAFVVILLALDAMLINTSIFYIFVGPLAWGVAVVVAFKWGIKDALVEYAKAKK